MNHRLLMELLRNGLTSVVVILAILAVAVILVHVLPLERSRPMTWRYCEHYFHSLARAKGERSKRGWASISRPIIRGLRFSWIQRPTLLISQL